MKCTFFKSNTDRDGSRKRKPVSCKIYDPQKKPRVHTEEEILDLCRYLKSEEKPCEMSYLLSDTKKSSFVNTKLGCFAFFESFY